MPPYAPGVIASEALHGFCRKEQEGLLTPQEYAQAVGDFHAFMTSVLPPPSGDGSLIARADGIRAGYGCSRSADALYLALAEELSGTHTAVLLTFERCS